MSMQISVSALLLSLALGAPWIARAQNLDKGTSITVLHYNEKTDLFLIQLNNEKAVGPNYVTSEALRAALEYEGSKADFNKQRPQMKDSVYTTRKPLRILDLKEVARRASKAERKKK